MTMKRLLLFLLITLSLSVAAQPAGYYNSASGLTGTQLKSALHNIIKGHNSITYAGIWDAFWSTDNKGNGIVWDMYSDRPNGTPAYTYNLGQDQCGTYSGEGDCYNREHSWPQSWFNSDGTARTDLHHIFATDGYVNNRRSNYPFGEVSSATYTSSNGSKLGPCKTSGYSGTVFEPIDAYKGDFARALFYMSVRYYGEDSGWASSDMTTKSEIKGWAMTMLLRWNLLDPVSEKEIDRNNAIYEIQDNRNPFVDNPEYASMIWDPNWTSTNEVSENRLYVFPNPVSRGGVIQLHGDALMDADCLVIRDMLGTTLLSQPFQGRQHLSVTLSDRFVPGCYVMELEHQGETISVMKLFVIN